MEQIHAKEQSTYTIYELQGVVTKIQEEISEMRKIITGIANWPDPNIDLKTACLMKGVYYSSLSNNANRWRRPNGGVPDLILNNRDFWKPETVKEWIRLDDRELERRYKKKE